jgi:hypothetical protein
MATDQHCKNCDTPLEPSFRYCPNCGQETADSLTFGVLFSKTISDYFSVDARFFRSFFPLLFKPGVLARRFVDGKRLKYLHPAQFYLFISVLFFFLFSFNIRKADDEMSKALQKGFDQEISVDSVKVSEKDSIQIEEARKMLKKNQKMIGMSDKDMQTIDSVMANTAKDPNSVNTGMTFDFDKRILDSLITAGAPKEDKLKAMGMKEDASGLNKRFYEQMLKFYQQKGRGIVQTFYDTIPIAMFLLMPLFAMLLKLFYWKRGNFAHHMVFSFYFFTFLFTSFCLLILANMLFEVPVWIEVLITISYMLYLILALRNFYRSSWLGAFFKAGLISFAFMPFILIMTFIGIVFMAFMLY